MEKSITRHDLIAKIEELKSRYEDDMKRGLKTLALLDLEEIESIKTVIRIMF